MVNRYSAEVYRSNTSFPTNEDFRVFKPGVNRGAVLKDDQYKAESILDSGVKFHSHGDFLDYPHSGILNEPAWLNRYPSTETNRNRASARWTFYHFLGVDIEKSAPRTTDPEALADPNNPTLSNPACTVCHERLDPDYSQLVNAFDAQQTTIQERAQRFSGNAFNLKFLLADLVLSPWFRAKAIADASGDARDVELAELGVDRLLTPEELELKTNAVLGYAWGKSPSEWELDGFYSSLADRFRIYYGGIDSVGIKDRSTAMTALMANVAERQALELACGVVSLDFINSNPEDRRLFTRVDAITTPLSEAGEGYTVSIGDYGSRQIYDLPAAVSGGTKTLNISFTNDGYNETTGQDRNLYVDSIQVLRDGNVLQTLQAESFPSAPGFAQTTYDDGNVMGGVHSDEVDGQWQEVGWILWSVGFVAVNVDLPQDGDYTFRVRAWGSESGDGVEPNMTVTVSGGSTSGATRGASSIKAQSNNSRAWSWPEEECLFQRELSDEEWQVVGSDPQQMLYSWTSVLHYFLTHFDYLHE